MGCLRAIAVRVGSALVLAAIVTLCYVYRAPLADGVRRLRGRPSPDADTFAQPAEGAARRAAAILDGLERRGGPAYVDLTAEELASLVDAALARTARRVFDSVAVALREGEVRVRGSLDVTGIPREALGPLSGAIGPREPVEFGGALAADSAGRLWLDITALRLAGFPFPRGTIAALLRQLRIPQLEQAAVPIPGVTGIGDVRVSRRSVRVYRARPR